MGEVSTDLGGGYVPRSIIGMSRNTVNCFAERQDKQFVVDIVSTSGGISVVDSR